MSPHIASAWSRRAAESPESAANKRLATGADTDVAVVEQASGVVFMGVAVATVVTVVAAIAMPRQSRVETTS